jgi:hypothetical protein
MRSIGGIYGFPEGNTFGVGYDETIVPRRNFDAVMFVAETTAARRNRPSSWAPKPVPLPAPSNLELSGDGVPAAWQMSFDPRYAHAVAASDQPSPRGGRTVCLSREVPWRWGEAALTQTVSAQAFAGQRLRFAAALRTEAADLGAGALLYLKFLPKPAEDESDFFGATLATAASADAPVQSPQWIACAVEADVPEAADSFVLGLLMTGNGSAWFGDLELTVAGRK